MKTLALSKGQKAFVDSEDHAVASQYRWNYHEQSRSAQAWHKGGTVSLGRLILNIPMGDPRIVRYKNGNRLDNRKKNLTTSGKGAILNEALKRSRERKKQSATSHRIVAELLSTWRPSEIAGGACAVCDRGSIIIFNV